MLGQSKHDRRNGHRGQEWSALQERIIGAVKVDLDAAGGQSTDRQRRQEWADPDCRRNPDALEDVEDEVHVRYRERA
jgi:hypothetical protein